MRILPTLVTTLLVPCAAFAQAARDSQVPPLPKDSLSRAYTQACYTGVVQAQKVLPDVPQREDLLRRGYNSCDGSLLRMTRSGQVRQESSLAELACGYAVGAMFAKYGFAEEATSMSARALKAATACIEIVRTQGIK